MASGVRGYIRRNHLGLIAIFIALGGTTYAATEIGADDIARNAVRSKHIKAKQVKPGDVSPRLRDGCPPGTRALAPLCVRPATEAATVFAAIQDCGARGLRLPSFSEAEVLAVKHDVPGVGLSQFFWTDEEVGGDNFQVSDEDGFEGGSQTVLQTNATVRVVCVTDPRQGG